MFPLKTWTERAITIGLGLVLGIAITRLVDLGFAGIDWEKTTKAFGEIVQAIAILGAGWWFLAQRSNKQKISISHKVEFVHLSTSKLLLHAEISVTNTSRVLITPNLLIASLYQVLPVKSDLSAPRLAVSDPTDIWPQLQSLAIDCMDDETTLEPSETQRFFIDFILDLPLECVQLESEIYALENSKIAKVLYQQHKGKDFDANLLSGRDDVSVWDENSLHTISLLVPGREQQANISDVAKT